MEPNELDEEFRALVEFARGCEVPTGFGMMDSNGKVDLDAPVELWENCRMTHVFALAQMYGIPGTEDLVDHGVKSLAHYFRDPVYGGWYSSIEALPGKDGSGVPVNDRKQAYAQAFVILAASSALAAGHQDARKVLEEALAQQKEHWQDGDRPLVVESWNRDFSECEEYRGINANMHTVEALLAAGDVLADPELTERATRILEFVSDRARENGWHIPEHYTTSWVVDPQYNADRPADPFRPFGVTPGHSLEFARLMLNAAASRELRGLSAEGWLTQTAQELGTCAVEEGWDADGQPGFVYTTDFQGEPVVHERMHWVTCEAIGLGSVLAEVLEEEDPVASAQWSQRVNEWWDYAQQYFIESPGQWVHELDRNNEPSGITWPGKPDVYHAAQMTLIPRLPAAPAFAAALREGLLEV